MTKALRKNLKNRKGFTLIELIVVIAIIAILAAVLIPRFTGFTKSAREKSAISDTRNILVSLEALISQGQTPITEHDIEVFAGKTFDGTIAWKTGSENTDTFTYTVTLGSDDYVVAVNDGEIDTDFDDEVPTGNYSEVTEHTPSP